jgi:RNA methyltransferase, TrmH family
VITSARNRHVAAAARLKKRGLRDRYARFLVEGPLAVREAVEAGSVEAVLHNPEAGGRVTALVRRAQDLGIRTVAVSAPVMGHLTSTVTPQGVVAVSRFVHVGLEALPRSLGVVPVLCSVRDPGNAGTILRSADASGASAVVFAGESVDVYNSKTVRASAGSLFHLPVVRETDPARVVAELRARGARILAASADGQASVYEEDLTGPTAMLFGNEAWGLPPDVEGLADRSVRVPIPGRAESLNLASAATLILFEAARQGAAPGARLAELISASAHDTRLPLTVLKGFAATLAGRWDELEEKDRRALVRGLALDAERVAMMVTMLLDAAQLERRRLRLNRARLDLGAVGRWAADLLGTSPDAPPVRAEGRAEALADADRIRAVVLALCDGVLWWGEGAISIRAGVSEERAVLEVARGGPGPSRQQADAMFLASGDPDAKVALHVARRLVEAHGGTLACEGGDGVRFRVTLPPE